MPEGLSQESYASIVEQEHHDLMIVQELRFENEQLKETNQTLVAHKMELLLETEDLKDKSKRLEKRLLDSMEARAAREQKFQDEIKRQRLTMNTLFHDLADSKRQAELLKQQLRDTNTKLRLQQELTANIAFQQEQEDDDDTSDEETNHLAVDRKTHPQHPPIGSRLGHLFHRRRNNARLGPKTTKQMGHLANEHIALQEHLKNSNEHRDTEEILFGDGDVFFDDVDGGKSLEDIDYSPTVSTASSSGLHAYLPTAEEEPHIVHQEMRNGDNSGMSRLDRIKQKRRNLEALWRRSPTIKSVAAPAPAVASPSSLQQSWFANATRNRLPKENVSSLWNQPAYASHQNSRRQDNTAAPTDSQNLVSLMNREED
jgi:hypothetical protein